MRIAMVLAVVLMTALVLPVMDAGATDEVYRWVDENGIVHFGDRPPEQVDAEQVDIQPAKGSGITPHVDPAPVAAGEQQAPQVSYAQQRRDERAKKHKEDAEREKKTAAACERNRQFVAQLEPRPPGVLVHKEDGTVVRMDDNERLERLAEAQAFIAENCNK
jgi:hypothetical protein